MSEALIKLPDAGILHDPDYALDWTLDRFQPSAWAADGRPMQDAVGGRGTVVFVAAEQAELAIRHYRRGGMVGRFFEDHYLWLGPDRTRSFREWRLLAHLSQRGLPVPRPVAAAYRRQGWRYTADLITVRIAGAAPLSRHLQARSLPAEIWRRLGYCVRRFHDAGVCHADLTGHNLLLDDDGRPWLLDFDRGRIRHDGGWRQQNLARLRRSLDKIVREQPHTVFEARDWHSFMSGYAQISA